MQINRLFGLVNFLLVNGTATAGELAKRFEVSERTILRDIDTLSAAKIPVYTMQGKGGGIALLDSYVLNKTAISDEEQNQILFALQSLSEAGQADAEQILVKLRALFDKAATDWIQMDFSRWGNSQTDNQRFETLKRAIIRKQAVRFTYVSSGGQTTERSACPLRLVFKSRAWYLQGFCLLKKDYRTFRISRMLGLEPLTESFEGQGLNPPPIEAGETASGALIKLKIAFAPCSAYRIYDDFDERHIEILEDGSRLVEVELPDDEWIYGFLLSLGTSARVLEPRSVRARLLEKIEALKNFYSKT
ncbi:MAG: YafY family transcriptional regulator [Candidatus Adiutrix sp.]|jgi:predicted DNA-binding transcriptional regulator YafY|nr:YafY family transcriptional regulator [Candidatus Adiutrix sp.]